MLKKRLTLYKMYAIMGYRNLKGDDNMLDRKEIAEMGSEQIRSILRDIIQEHGTCELLDVLTYQNVKDYFSDEWNEDQIHRDL